MAVAHWSKSILLRRGGPSVVPSPAALIRFFSSREARGLDEPPDSNHNSDDLSEIAKKVCHITRSRPRWEQTLASDFPSLDFSNPVFFHEYLKHQSNLLVSMRFFYWCLSHHGASPDPDSCRLLFDALVEANACRAAKLLIARTDFTPESTSLEQYSVCLFKEGLVEDGMEALRQLRGWGFAAKTETWNVALSGCVKARRTDFVWELYNDLVVSGSLADMGETAVGHLIQAFCLDDEDSRGYELLRVVLDDGLVPPEAAFNELISKYCETRSFDRVSELLHIMIKKNCGPSLYTYHTVLNGLFKGKEPREAVRVFNELKVRGYTPDRAMYTTMINRLCEIGWVSTARKLSFEMINEGCVPDERTACTMIGALFKLGNVKAASRLFVELCEKGLGGSTLIYNTMIHRLILHNKLEQAVGIFREMPTKGVARDFTTYLSLIREFWTRNEIKESRHLYEEAVAEGLLPPVSDFESLINDRHPEEVDTASLSRQGEECL